jgi:flagellar biosynthesis protein FlhF
MRLRTIVAPTVPQALGAVQEELGPDAFVLETKTRQGLAEVVAAADDGEKPAEAIQRLRAELALLRRELLDVLARGSPPAADRESAVARRLAEEGLAPELLSAVLARLEAAPPQETERIDPLTSPAALEAVRAVLPGFSASAASAASRFAFVGPPAAGKTTTLLRIASRLRRQGRRRVAILAIVDRGAGAGGLLPVQARRLGAPLLVAAGPSEVRAALRSLESSEVVLVDTPGFPFREAGAIDSLRRALAALEGVTSHLVIAASADASVLEATAAAYRALHPQAVVFTRLDEVTRRGEIANLSAAAGLPVAALGFGRSIEADFVSAGPAVVAELLLGRRTLPPEGGAA